MIKKLGISIIKLVLLAFSAFIASLAFPGQYSANEFPFLAFIYLIPVFIILNKSNVKESILQGLVYGFTFYLIYNYWLSTFHPAAIYIAPLIKSIQYAIFFPFLTYAYKKTKKRGYLLQSLIYIAFFYITSLGFVGYPYGCIASALYEMLPFIQITSITGIHGLNFILIFPQALVAKIICDKNLKSYYKDLIYVVIVFILNYTLGLVAINYYDNQTPDKILKIAAIQHNADTWEGGSTSYKNNLETLMKYSNLALEENPDLDMISWAETAFVPSLAWYTADLPGIKSNKNLTNILLDFATNLSVPLVIGNPTEIVKNNGLGPVLENGSRNRDIYNSVIMFQTGEIKETYRKQHLVPFTEHFPYKEQLPKIAAFLASLDLKWWEPGNEIVVFDYDGINFSTPICFEDTFGYISAEFVDQGADFLLNVSNDFWSQAVTAEVQHLQLAVFRAVENRVPLLRTTNSGITCLVSTSGEIIDAMPPFVQGYEVYDIPIVLDKNKTFYTLAPDAAVHLAILISALWLILSTINRGKEKKHAKYDDIFNSVDDRYEC